MGRLVEEVRLWNTPVVGAYLLWRFTKGFTEHHADGEPPSALLHFVALAILTSPYLSEAISRRRPNLQSYVRGFEEYKRSDLLLGIHDRVLSKREYTLAAMDIAVAKGLLVWDTEHGWLHARSQGIKPSRGCRPRGAMEKAGERAAILGMWLAEHDMNMIGVYLGVGF